MLVQHQRNPFFVPYWVIDTVTRQGGKISDILELSKAREHLSGEDLACIAALNKNAKQYFGFDNEQTLLSAWQYAQGDWETFRNHVEPMIAMVSRTLEVRLFDDPELFDKYPEPFSVKDVSSEILLVVIYPGHFAQVNAAKNKGLLVRELLKLFYAYDGFGAVSSNRLFDTYICNLAGSIG